MRNNEYETEANDTETQIMNWNHPKASDYSNTIAAKIPGYTNLYEMGVQILRSTLDPQRSHSPSTHPTHPHLLIAGAGGGQELATFGSAEANWMFTGVDPSALMLEKARERIAQSDIATRTVLVQGELTSWLVKPDDPLYTAATCLLVLHFVRGIEAKKALLQALSDRLEPGAPLLLASLNADLDSPAFLVVMEAWRLHMLSQGIAEEDWLNFASSLGTESDPIPASVIEQLLEECGFRHAQRYFGAFLIDGWVAFKQREGEV